MFALINHLHINFDDISDILVVELADFDAVFLGEMSPVIRPQLSLCFLCTSFSEDIANRSGILAT